jgi:hypothetical protein
VLDHIREELVSFILSGEHYGSAISPANQKNGSGAESLFPLFLLAYRLTIVAADVLLWLVNRFVLMQGQIKSILNGVVVVVLVLWIASLYGLFQHLNQFRVGR